MTSIGTDARQATRGYRSGGFIVAAVHAGSRDFDNVVNRARELADVSGRQVVFLTVVTRRPLSTELTRTRIRLARHPMTVHLVGAWIDGENLAAAELTEQVAEELVRGAQELAAGTLILGLDPTLDVPATSVPAHVARLLPREIDLVFSSEELKATPSSLVVSGFARGAHASLVK
jgi:hypothetical protein